MKTCGKCKETKPLDDFYNNASCKSSQCKECTRQRSKAWYYKNRAYSIKCAREWCIKNPERSAETLQLYCEKNKKKIIDRANKWQKENPEKTALNKRNSRINNKEKYNQRSIDWCLKNSERRKQQSKNYADKNRATIHANTRRRQINKLKAVAAWGNKFFIEEAYSLAALRTKIFGYKWEVDHIVPLQSKLVCGLHVEHNLQVISRNANRKKSNHYWPDMPEGQIEIGQ
jgi:hypothetical protein